MNKSYARFAGSGDRHFGRFFRGFGDWHANGAELGGKDGFGGVLGHALVQLLERHCGTERQPASPDAIALAPAWLLLVWLDRRSVLNINAAICAICGGLCVGLLHPLLNMAFGVDVFAPARSWSGLLWQATAGAFGGWAMASLWRNRENAASNR